MFKLILSLIIMTFLVTSQMLWAVLPGSGPSCDHIMAGLNPLETYEIFGDPLAELKQGANAVTAKSKDLTNENLGRLLVANTRRNLDQLQNLFQVVKELSLKLEDDCDRKIIAIQNFRKRLPKTSLSEIKITNEHFRSGIYYIGRNEWQTQLDIFQRDWEKFYENEIRLGDFIRALRESSNIMSLPEVQKSLQNVVVNGLKDTVFTEVALSGDARGRDANAPVSINYLILDYLNGHVGPNSIFDKSSENIQVLVNRNLLTQILQELIRNGNKASQLRHPNWMTETPRVWEHSIATTRVKRDAEGNALIEIEDRGDPLQWAQTQNRIGGSTHNTMGIGRFRASLLAHYLGFRIEYKALPNNEGTLVTLTIPQQDVID